MRAPGADAGSVLILRALGLGDLLTALPALRAVRRHYPRHEVVLAAPERLREVVEELGCVDRLLPTGSDDRRVPRTLAWEGRPPDVAVNLHGSGPQSVELLRAVGAGQLFSYGAGGPVWDADEHERARWCRMLRWYGVPADAEDFLLRERDTSSGTYVVLHPGADSEARRWPVERFAQVAACLDDVVITAGRGEGARAHAIAAEAGLGRDAVVGGESDISFKALADLVGNAGALVSGDTGVAHLAVSLATPSVTLFGPVSPALWGPPARPEHIALWHPDPDGGLRPGDARGAVADERLLRICADEVLHALGAVRSGAVRPGSGHTGCGRPTSE